MLFHGGSGGSFGNIPPVGTSAWKAWQAARRADPGATANPWSYSPISSSGSPLYNSALGNTTLSGSPVDDAVTSALDSISPDSPKPPSGPRRDPGSGPVYSQPQTFDYLDAPWASAYGMSKETAYSEAMENTAYRRSVADMQKAGLNPATIFGAGNGYTAGSPGYIRSQSSGSGGGSGSRRSRGSSRSSGRFFSSSAYSILSTLGGIVGASATHSAGGYWIGASLTQGAMNAIDAFSRWRR